MNCRGVPQGVGMDASALRRGSIVRQVLAQQVTHAESGERSAVAVTKHGGRCRIRVPRRLARKEIPKQPRGSRPQGTEADLVAFAVQAYLLGRLEPQIAQPKVEDLLDPRPGIEHEGKQSVIALPGGRAPIDVVHERLNIGALGVLDRHFRRPALERDGEDALHHAELFGVLGPEMPDEGAESCEPGITGTDAVATLSFEVHQESLDALGGKIGNAERLEPSPRVACGKLQPQHDRVTVAADRVDAHPSLLGQILLEETDYEATEVRGRQALHGSPPNTRRPNAASKRALASWATAGMSLR